MACYCGKEFTTVFKIYYYKIIFHVLFCRGPVHWRITDETCWTYIWLFVKRRLKWKITLFRKKKSSLWCQNHFSWIIFLVYKNYKFLHSNPWNKTIIPSSVPVLNYYITKCSLKNVTLCMLSISCINNAYKEVKENMRKTYLRIN